MVGVLAYDEFSRETVIRAAPPWNIKLSPWSERVWSSHDDLLATEWLQREGIDYAEVVTRLSSRRLTA